MSYGYVAEVDLSFALRILNWKWKRTNSLQFFIYLFLYTYHIPTVFCLARITTCVIGNRRGEDALEHIESGENFCNVLGSQKLPRKIFK